MPYGQVTYGLEADRFPEDRREQINQDIGQTQSGQERQPGKSIPFVLEVEVNAQGNAVPVSWWVRDRNYRFHSSRFICQVAPSAAPAPAINPVLIP